MMPPSAGDSFLMQMPTDELDRLYLGFDPVKSPISFSVSHHFLAELNENATPQFTQTFRPNRRALAVEVEQILQELSNSQSSRKVKAKVHCKDNRLANLRRHIEVISQRQTLMMQTIQNQTLALKQLRRRPVR